MAGVTLSSFRWFQGKLLIKSPQGSLEVIKIRLIMLRILEQKNVPIYFRVRWNTFGNPLYCRHQWNQIYPTPASVCSRRTCGPADTCKIRKNSFSLPISSCWQDLAISQVLFVSVLKVQILLCVATSLNSLPGCFIAAWRIFLCFVSFSLPASTRKVF